jgi:hypothetical protein
MVYVPAPGYTPLDPPVETGSPSAALVEQRNLTHWFIMEDPTPLSLIPSGKQRLPSGGTSNTDMPPRPQQMFKLIANSASERPAKGQNSAGQQSKYDFTLVGEWDATVRKGDWWEDDNGQRWVVDSVVFGNRYEVKAMVMSYGEVLPSG